MMIEDGAGADLRRDYSSSSRARPQSQEGPAAAQQREQDAAADSKHEQERGEQPHRHKLQRGEDSSRLIPHCEQSSSSSSVTAVTPVTSLSLAAAHPALYSPQAVDEYLLGGLLAPPRALLQTLANFERASNEMEAVFQTFTALGGVPPADCEADLIPLSRRHQRLGFATPADMRPAVLEAAFMQTGSGLEQQQQAEVVQQIDGPKSRAAQQELPGCITEGRS